MDVNGFIAGSRLVVGNSMVFDKESYAVFGSNSSAHPVRIAADGDLSNDKGITVDYSGNVGIGTVGPGAKLEVAGTIKATGLAISGPLSFPGNELVLAGIPVARTAPEDADLETVLVDRKTGKLYLQ